MTLENDPYVWTNKLDVLRLDFWSKHRASRLARTWATITIFKKFPKKNFFFWNFFLLHRFRPKFTALALLRISGGKGAIFLLIVVISFSYVFVHFVWQLKGGGLIPAFEGSNRARTQCGQIADTAPQLPIDRGAKWPCFWLPYAIWVGV